MLFLTTGGNGAGKTLLTLKTVRERSLAENRPVYYNGRFRLTADFGWTKIDMKDWQSVPDGAIFFVDECHNDFPKSNGKDSPEYIRMLAEHRVRGFDFYLITQHPLNIDAFVRRLIAAPGWHRHLKRTGGAPLVSVIEWASVNDKCEKPGSGASGSVVMTPFPKEVYSWYESATLHTAKTKIPFQVKLFIGCLLLVPVLGYYAWSTFNNRILKKNGEPSIVSKFAAASASGGGQSVNAKAMTPQEYVAQFASRLEGLPHTAPRYDDLTKPVSAPFPAACVSMGERCTCYTQQATKMDVAKPLCLQIVKYGYFNDWQQVAAAPSGDVVGGSAPSIPPPVPTHLLGQGVTASAGELMPQKHLPVSRQAPRS